MTDRPELLIVPATVRDADALAALHALSFAEAWSAGAIARLIGAEAGVALIASGGPDLLPAGFILAFAAVDEAEILSIAVRPEHRRNGIARRLVEALIAEVAEQGASRIHLEVGARNVPALALYRRLGFEPTGRRIGYYRHAGEPTEDALLMMREL